MLEYGQAVWQPSLKTLRQDLEDVQRRATRMISKLKGKSYPERLATLKLPSLEHRRRRGDMIELYKYQTGLYNTSRPVFRPYSGGETRGHCKKLAKISNNTRIRSDFFSQRIHGMERASQKSSDSIKPQFFQESFWRSLAKSSQHLRPWLLPLAHWHAHCVSSPDIRSVNKPS